ncbi:hypothetical protein [Bacillus testis]|uniref:hypothetical protein n=1 Tax=Bacillus testis TaxID=1622072 RepID=UPI000A8EB512|nr:hypothetical protein [Bacillus testis]
MLFPEIEQKAKEVTEAVEQGECFYIKKHYNGLMADIEALKNLVGKQFESYIREEN